MAPRRLILHCCAWSMAAGHVPAWTPSAVFGGRRLESSSGSGEAGSGSGEVGSGYRHHPRHRLHLRRPPLRRRPRRRPHHALKIYGRRTEPRKETRWNQIRIASIRLLLYRTQAGAPAALKFVLTTIMNLHKTIDTALSPVVSERWQYASCTHGESKIHSRH